MGLLKWLFGGNSNSAVASHTLVLPAGRFGQGRHKPPGKWVQTTLAVKVAGLHHRRDDALRFFSAVSDAERRGTLYGVQLRPDPNNRYDRNAIAVDGVVGSKRWHIGFLDRDTAAEINSDLISKGVSVAVELYSLWAGDDGFIDATVIVLAPPGHSHNMRIRR